MSKKKRSFFVVVFTFVQIEAISRKLLIAKFKMAIMRLNDRKVRKFIKFNVLQLGSFW